MLVYIRDKFRLSGRTTFSRGELSLILGVYGARVQRGVWRDYAIDSLPDMAVFSIFRSTHEKPLYSVAKISSRSLIKPAQYVVYSGNDTLKRSNSLEEVLAFLEELA
jgi:hypothetical protein